MTKRQWLLQFADMFMWAFFGSMMGIALAQVLR